jgi:hypothetical protein
VVKTPIMGVKRGIRVPREHAARLQKQKRITGNKEQVETRLG